MTLHEVYIALFWIVIGGYVAYLGWTVYRVAAERAARARHPSRESDQGTPRLSRGTARTPGSPVAHGGDSRKDTAPMC